MTGKHARKMRLVGKPAGDGNLRNGIITAAQERHGAIGPAAQYEGVGRHAEGVSESTIEIACAEPRLLRQRLDADLLIQVFIDERRDPAPLPRGKEAANAVPVLHGGLQRFQQNRNFVQPHPCRIRVARYEGRGVVEESLNSGGPDVCSFTFTDDHVHQAFSRSMIHENHLGTIVFWI